MPVARWPIRSANGSGQSKVSRASFLACQMDEQYRPLQRLVLLAALPASDQFNQTREERSEVRRQLENALVHINSHNCKESDYYALKEITLESVVDQGHAEQ